MPFDMIPEMTNHARLITRLARAGVLNDPATCSQWLQSRVNRLQRLSLMDELFPMLRACADAA